MESAFDNTVEKSLIDTCEKPIGKARYTMTKETELPKLAKIEQIAGGWTKKYHLVYDLPDGSIVNYDGISRKGPEDYRDALERNARQEKPVPDAVCMVPVLKDGSVVCIKEFRYPLNSWCISFPAGLIDPGEDVMTCVVRELHEEVGYQPRADLGAERAIHFLHQTGFSSAGLGEENVQMMFVEAEPAGERELQHGELIDMFILPRDQILNFLAEKFKI